MKIPLWKRTLSYLYEFHIESASSDHNPHLHVSVIRGQYQLCTEHAVYSYGTLYDNFSTAFAKMDLDRFPIKKVLVLGLGLASIPYILEKRYDKKYHYTGIEIDETVVYLANKYILDELESGIEVICTDAEFFIKQSKEQFDLICVDLFLDDIIPNKFEQVEFLQDIKRLLAPQGLLLYNRLATTSKDIAENELFFNTFFKAQFPEATYLSIDENWVLLNQKDSLKS